MGGGSSKTTMKMHFNLVMGYYVLLINWDSPISIEVCIATSDVPINGSLICSVVHSFDATLSSCRVVNFKFWLQS